MAGASRRWAAAAVAAVLLAGCASSEDKSAAERRPESEGFAWAGKGEQSNFGSDYNFCTRNTGGVGRSQSTTRAVNEIAGNATNMGSSEAYGPMRQNATRERHPRQLCRQARLLGMHGEPRLAARRRPLSHPPRACRQGSTRPDQAGQLSRGQQREAIP